MRRWTRAVAGAGLSALWLACSPRSVVPPVPPADVPAAEPSQRAESEPELAHPPAVVPGPLLTLPPIHIGQLANGLTVVVAERPGLPLTAIVYANRAAHDDGSAAGLAHFTMRTMKERATVSPGKNQSLQLGGDTPWSSASWRGTELGIVTTADRTERAVWTLARIVEHPALDGEALTAARRKSLAAISHLSVNTRQLLYRSVRRGLYGKDNALAEPPRP